VAWYVSPFGLFVLVAGLGIGAWKAGGVYQSLPTLCAGPSFSKHLGGKGVVVAAHRVVMDTLRFRLSCTRGSTLLVGTIPQAHLLLMSLMRGETGARAGEWLMQGWYFKINSGLLKI